MEYRDVDTLLAEGARRWGEQVYLESIGQGRRLSFAGLDAACHRLAHFLAERGVKPGDRVSLLSGNCLEAVVGFFGVQRGGAAVNPINVEVNVKNAGQILHDVDPRLVLWHPAIPEELRALMRARGGAAVALDGLFQALEAYPASPGGRRPPSPRDLAIIDYTSGSTARPKGVCISHEAYFYMARSPAERLALAESDRMLECRALSWASPQCLTLGPTLQTGARLVLAPRFSRSRFFGWIRDHGVTIAAGVPTLITMLLDQPVAVTGRDLPGLKFITSSAAPLPVERQDEFERRYGIPIVQMCGMSEAGFMGGNPPGAPRRGSIGPAMPHIRARFVDETGAECAPGREGELVVSGRQLASAYLTDRGVLVPLPQDGFPTGDIGHVDADGYLYLTGRRKDLIIRGGVNIAPMEITTALLAHPAVADAATIGVPDQLYGEGVVSFVASRAGERVAPEELMRHCRERLSDFKLPQRIFVLDVIPKTDRGKLARERLLAIWQERGARNGR